jgi:hypothetical protein
MYLPQFGVCVLVGMALVQGYESVREPLRARRVRLGLTGLALAGVLLAAVFMSRQAMNHMSYRRDTSHENRAFLSQLVSAIPDVPDGAVLYVADAPRSLSLNPDDGFYLRPAVRLWYGKHVDLRVGERPDETAGSTDTLEFRWERWR